MRFTWYDYDKEYADVVEDWLDSDAIKFTGCNDGFNSFYEYWKNSDAMTLGKNYWSKVIIENGIPIAVIAISLYQNIFTIMEYIVDPKIRGKGYGEAILKELIENGTNIIGKDIMLLESVIYPNNIAAQKSFEKAGFVFRNTHPDGDAWYYQYEKYIF